MVIETGRGGLAEPDRPKVDTPWRRGFASLAIAGEGIWFS